ncbi:signal transduction histidine kinase [Leucobacter exalbidus]|uniref:histidine kinase n=1 Tax=Leucobacter exalbidus TaxID=662960 RepID=A0A940PMI6_9MICO|nr:histidine kinase [Leucobacter exalbidus]MBP1326677.1 signal transduction histidine kinase [Leucobacter exalbidus]
MNAQTAGNAGASRHPAAAPQPIPAPRSRPLLWWDVGVTALILLMCVPGGTGALDWSDTAAGWGGRLALHLGALAAFVLLYLALGRAALRRGIQDIPPTAASYAFSALLLIVVGAAVAIEPSYATLQALAYPMFWVMTPRYRNAVIWSGLLATAVGVGSAYAYLVRAIEDPYWTALAVAILSFGFSVVLGTWITRVFEQGERHRLIAEQLRQSQREVAALSSEAGAASERERLSRELHDTLTQTLAGLVMLSEQATRALDAGDPDRAHDRLSRVESAAREAVAEARALVATSQPLGDGGLQAAIERVVTRMGADTGLSIDWAMTPVTLSRAHQVMLLRAVQEGLANVRKHARATWAGVTLTEDVDGALLRVADNGMGVAHDSVSGFGLSGLADRVGAAGGTVSFGPGPEGGALLEVRIPHPMTNSGPTSHPEQGAPA